MFYGLPGLRKYLFGYQKAAKKVVYGLPGLRKHLLGSKMIQKRCLQGPRASCGIGVRLQGNVGCVIRAVMAMAPSIQVKLQQ